MSELLYVPGTGLIYRLDPRSKYLATLGLVVYLALESSTEVLLLVLVALHVVAFSCTSTRTRLLLLWRTLAPLLIPVVVLGSLRWRAEHALLALGPVTVTVEALWAAVGVGARIAGISLLVSLVLWSTELGDAIVGLTRLGLPFAVGFPFVMALQYVVTFRRQFQHILEAQQSRGLIFSRGNPFQVARAYIPVLVPLIITALRSVDSLALALQSRGFRVGQQRTSRRVLRMQARDWVFLLATACTLVTLACV